MSSASVSAAAAYGDAAGALAGAWLAGATDAGAPEAAGEALAPPLEHAAAITPAAASNATSRCFGR